MRGHQVFALIILVGLFCPKLVFSQESFQGNSQMPEVIVTAKESKDSITVQTPQLAEETIKNTPGGVDLISQDDYKSGRATMITDVLSYSPGVFAQQRDTGAQESRVSIRGSGLQRTFHLRGIKLLQDGIPINDADGSGDFYRVEPLATEYTEVYRGGNALRYGSTTLGGAINLVSPTGYDSDKLQGRVEAGSFGYIRSQLSSGQVMGPADYYVSLSQFKQEGFRNHTEQDSHYEFSDVGYKISDSLETRVYATNAVIKAKLGGALRKSQLLADPTQANASSVSGNQKRDMTYYRLANKTTYKEDDIQLDFSLFGSKMDMFHPIFQVLDIDTTNYGGEILYTNQADWMDRENQLTVGFSPTLVYYTDDRYVNAGGEKGARTAEFDNKAYNLDLYMEDQWKFMDRWSFVPGAQLSYADRQITDYFQANGDDSGNAVYRSINPKAGLLYDLTETTQGFFGYSRNFEPPTFSELFNNAGDFLNNKAQRGHTWETGVRGQEGIFSYDATYYYSIINKELLSLSDGSGNPLGTINARGETIHQGIELGGKVDLLQGILVKDEEAQDKIYTHGVYNWSRFRFDADPVYGNNQLPSMPEHFIKMELMYEHPSGIYFGPNWERVASKYPIDMANTYFADTYNIWGLKAGYKMPKGFSIFVEGKNITDEIYAASTSIVNNAAGADTNAVFNPGNGRAWYGGVEWKW
jgi:iron complex outermembrane receptor protein